jgi:hypothetical protein
MNKQFAVSASGDHPIQIIPQQSEQVIQLMDNVVISETSETRFYAVSVRMTLTFLIFCCFSVFQY